MPCKKSVLISIFFSWAVFFLSASLSYANLCPNPSPQASQVFRDFKKVLNAEYFDKRVSEKEYIRICEERYKRGSEEHINLCNNFNKDFLNWIMIGHALGRLAPAVQDQPDRRIAFDCVQLGLEQINASEITESYVPSLFFRVMMQAGYGMHDDKLDILIKGGLSTEPLYDVLGGKIKTPTSSKRPEGGKSPADKTTPRTTLKDPVVSGSVSAPGGSSSGGKVAGAGSSEGHCSNWMTLSFSDSKGELDPVDTEEACTVTGNTGDFITKTNPVTKACHVCSKDDWTPPSPPTPIDTTGGGGVSGGTASGGGLSTSGDSSGKMKCQLYSGYIFSTEPGAKFNVLQAKKPDPRGYIEFLYTVGVKTDRFNSIERARKDAERIVKEGTRAKQYVFALRDSSKDAFCNFIESQCDMNVSSVNIAAKGCGWSK